MMRVSEAIPTGRLADWLRPDAFTPRGRYEERDLMGAPGRFADWMEISCLFQTDETLSGVEVLDHLRDAGVLIDDRSGETGEMIMASVFSELSRRRREFPDGAPFSFPFSIEPMILRRTISIWNDAPFYAFLLLVSAGQMAPTLLTKATSYHEVGHLFEQVVGAACFGLFRATAVVLDTTGSQKNHKLWRRVRPAIQPFQRDVRPKLKLAPTRLKDGGLDVIAKLEVGDLRPGLLHLLVQCAAGQDWRKKLGQPPLATWREYVDWRGPISRVVAVPTLFGDDRTLEDASMGAEWAIFIDRTRLLWGLSRSPGVDAFLNDRLRRWCTTRLALLRDYGIEIAA